MEPLPYLRPTNLPPPNTDIPYGEHKSLSHQHHPIFNLFHPLSLHRNPPPSALCPNHLSHHRPHMGHPDQHPQREKLPHHPLTHPTPPLRFRQEILSLRRRETQSRKNREFLRDRRLGGHWVLGELAGRQ